MIPKIAKAIQLNDLSTAAAGFARIAEFEKEAFSQLLKYVGEPG